MDKDSGLSAKQRIMNATIALTNERSAQFVQLRDIARASGVSPSLILFHFVSREDLILEARFQAYENGRGAELDQALANGPPMPLPELVDMLAHGDMAGGHKVRDFMALSWWWSTEDEARFDRCLKMREAAYRRAFMMVDPPLSPSRIEALSTVAPLLYIGILRLGAVHRWPARDVAAKVTSLLTAMIGE